MAAESINLSDRIVNLLKQSKQSTGQLAKSIFGEDGHPSMINHVLKRLRREGSVRKEDGLWIYVEDAGIEGFTERLSLDINEVLYQRWLTSKGVGYALKSNEVAEELTKKSGVPADSNLVKDALARSVRSGKIVMFQDVRIGPDFYYVISERGKKPDGEMAKEKLLEHLSKNNGWISTKMLVKSLNPKNKSEYKNYRRLVNGIMYKLLEQKRVNLQKDASGKKPFWQLNPYATQT